jgi:hypothetical protein
MVEGRGIAWRPFPIKGEIVMKNPLIGGRKSASLVVVFVGLVTLGLGNASALADEESQGCTNAILDGTYQWNVAGFVQTTNKNGGNIGDFAPIVEASYAVFDGHGTITNLVSTDNFSSTGSFTVTGTGTYTVNPDCSGSLTFNTAGGPINRHLEIRDRETVDFVHTDTGLIIAGTMKKREKLAKSHPG